MTADGVLLYDPMIGGHLRIASISLSAADREDTIVTFHARYGCICCGDRTDRCTPTRCAVEEPL